MLIGETTGHREPSWRPGGRVDSAVACGQDGRVSRLNIVLILLSACGAPGASPSGDVGPADARDADVDDRRVEDDPEPPDVPVATAPDAPAGVPLWRVHLSEGREVVGEHLWTYDRNRWWEPAPEFTHALFDVSRLRPYPNDRSVRFVDQSEIERVEFLEAPGRRGYRQALRDEGIALQRSPLDGVAHVITGHDSYHLEEQGYGDNAWDLVFTDELGRRYTGDGTQNEDHLIWAQPVYLPTAGYVVEVVRDAPDNVVGEHPGFGAPNNLVGVHLGGAYYVYLYHFRQGSIPENVAVDAWLDAGAYLGEVGNSGVTLEPHLHLTVLWYDAAAEPPRSWSVPSEFVGLWTAPVPGGPARLQDFVDPPTGTWLSSEEF